MNGHFHPISGNFHASWIANGAQDQDDQPPPVRPKSWKAPQNIGVEMKRTGRSCLTGFTLVMAALAPVHAPAQETYPSHPIKIIVPFPPGGVVDALGRLLGERLSAKLGQPVAVENRPGASGNVGAELVAKAKPDGYTLMVAPPPPLVINQSLYPKLSYNPLAFVPITVIARAPNVLVAHPSLKANNAGELIAEARAQPGKLKYVSTGSGGTPHVTAEWFKSVANIDLTHVPFQGALAYPALLKGDAQVMFMPLSDALPHIRSGKLKALAVGSEKRIPELPDLPSITETVPGFNSTAWWGIVSAPGTPQQIVEELSAAIAEELRQPDTLKKLEGMGVDPVGGSPTQTAAFFKEEAERWGNVIREAKIKVD
jgi:tripartite-type tricarboxylate transporter receptor subunit TctC